MNDNFKKWFGDSEAVDKNGNPLVVNHSTLDDDFNVFYGGRIFRTSNRETEVKPIWFSYGEAYATDPEIKNIKAYLKIDKLFDFSNKSHLKEYEKYVTENYPSYPTENIEYYNEDWESLEEDNVPAYLYEMGYDGWKTTQENAIAVFNSKQIKLADGSNTTFDGNNPDIRFDEGGAVESDNFKKWFGDSKVVDDEGNPLVVYHGTTHDFDSFELERGNTGNAVGTGYYFTTSPEDASINYAGEGADLTNKIEREREKVASELEYEYDDVDDIVRDFEVTEEEAQRLLEEQDPDLIDTLAIREAKKRIKGEHDGAIIPAYIKIEKPFDMTDDKERYGIEWDEEYYVNEAKDDVEKEDYIDEDGDFDEDSYNDAVMDTARTMYYEDYSPSEDGNGVELADALRDIVYGRKYYIDDPSGKVYEFEYYLKEYSPTAKDVYDKIVELFMHEQFSEDGNLANHQIFRDMIVKAGFDGAIQDAYAEFGRGRRMGAPMEGIEYGDKHYIVFEPTQIKSAIGNNGEYDPNNPNIIMRKGGNVTTWKHKYNKKYGYKKNESHSLKEISKDTGVSMKGLQQIYDKGIGAYKTNPSSVRPNVKSKEQWAMARVYSAVMGGKAADVDKKELKMKQGGSVYRPKTKKYYSSRLMIPNVRGGWTKDKILRYLKQNKSESKSSYGIAALITEFDSAEDFANHIYYHGTTNSVSDGLKPSITLSEREAERIGGGGYGERYWGISLTKKKKVAESFSGQSDYVSVYPVILKPDAKVVNREDLQDASDIEDIIVDLYTDGVDAVWIGGGEEELVVVNPLSIVLYRDGRDGYSVFGGFKSEQPTAEQIKSIYDRAFKEYEEKKKELEKAQDIEDRQERIDTRKQITRSVEKFQFKEGGQTPAQKEKIAFVMGEFKDGKLKTSYGEKVTDRKQAIAIALSEAGVEKMYRGGELEQYNKWRSIDWDEFKIDSKKRSNIYRLFGWAESERINWDKMPEEDRESFLDIITQFNSKDTLEYIFRDNIEEIEKDYEALMEDESLEDIEDIKKLNAATTKLLNSEDYSYLKERMDEYGFSEKDLQKKSTKELLYQASEDKDLTWVIDYFLLDDNNWLDFEYISDYGSDYLDRLYYNLLEKGAVFTEEAEEQQYDLFDTDKEMPKPVEKDSKSLVKGKVAFWNWFEENNWKELEGEQIEKEGLDMYAVGVAYKSPDGRTLYGFSSSARLVTNDGEVQKTILRQDDEPIIILDALVVEEKGKGLGKKAIKLLTSVADKTDVTIQLQPSPINAIGEVLSVKQLTEFYKKAGFKLKYNGSGSDKIMQYTPNTSKPVEKEESKTESKIPLLQFYDRMMDKGWKVLSYDEKQKAIKNTDSASMLEKDGVYIGFKMGYYISPHQHGVIFTDARYGGFKGADETNAGVLTEIYVENSKKGLGTKAMKDVAQSADESSMMLMLEPTPLGKVKKTLNREQLVEWYRKFGFEDYSDETWRDGAKTDWLMYRLPKNWKKEEGLSVGEEIKIEYEALKSIKDDIDDEKTREDIDAEILGLSIIYEELVGKPIDEESKMIDGGIIIDKNNIYTTTDTHIAPKRICFHYKDRNGKIEQIGYAITDIYFCDQETLSLQEYVVKKEYAKPFVHKEVMKQIKDALRYTGKDKILVNNTIY
jgi:hypothetical protein